MKNIISLSRRTDIPAFYAEWFVRKLKKQYVYVRHPYTKEIFHVSLKPVNVLGFVFWSKNFSPLLPYLGKIEKVIGNLFFHFTITGMSKDIEMNTPSYKDAAKDFIFISKKYSPDNVIWRFDPLCITDKISFQEHLESFRQCAEELKGYVHICYISFANPYYKVIKNFQRYTLHTLLDIPVEEKRNYAKHLAETANQYRIKIYACCNDYLLSDGIQKSSCINKNYLSKVWNLDGIDYEPSSPTRKECACTRSIDIGAYDTCPHGCIYLLMLRKYRQRKGRLFL